MQIPTIRKSATRYLAVPKFIALLAVLALFALAAAPSALAQSDGFTESVFLSAGFDGSNPVGGVVLAADGNFYGVTTNGGTEDDGVLYKVTPSGAVSTVYSFCAKAKCADGQFPTSGLIQGSDGNFYGTTQSGGANGGGIAFKVTPSGTLTVLYAFCSVYTTVCTDGKNPGQLVQGTDGNFYGTAGGGTNTYGNGNQGGIVFQLTPAGKLTVLHSFCSQTNCSDGGLPSSGLVQASDGNFYGLAASGGSTGYGVAYRVTAGGAYSIVHSFCAVLADKLCEDGGGPNGTLVEAADTSFYGVTQLGGPNVATGAGGGTAFNLTTGGTLTTLYSFCSQSNCTDGYAPASGLYLASDGNYYGTTLYGTQSNPQPVQDAVVFQLSGSTVTTVYTFCALKACTDGESPNGSLIQGSDGSLYSVTEFGGAYSSGTVYKLTHTPALAGPVHLSLGESTLSLGSSTTLSWSVSGAYSQTLQQCYAFVQNGATGAGSWSGKNPGSTGGATGSVTLTPTAAGTYTYALTCGGVESGFATLTVAAQPTTTAIVANPNPPTVGQQVLLTAQVRRTSGGGFATGSVTFASGTTFIGTSTLNGSGVATFTASTNGLTPGTYPVIATYGGDSADAASTSPSLPVTLNKAPTTVTLTANPTSVTPPATVALQATVKRSATSATGTPTGSVTFSSGSTLIATVNLSGGVASYSAPTSSVGPGTYGVTAKYNGDGSDASSVSSSVSVTVK